MMREGGSTAEEGGSRHGERMRIIAGEKDAGEQLKALCREAGWVVLPDGTTFRKGCRPPLPAIEIGATSTTTTPSSWQKPSPPSSSFPSPIPSYQCSPSSSSFDMNQNLFYYLRTAMPSSLPPLRISNSALVTPPPLSLTSKCPKTNNYTWESFINFVF